MRKHVFEDAGLGDTCIFCGATSEYGPDCQTQQKINESHDWQAFTSRKGLSQMARCTKCKMEVYAGGFPPHAIRSCEHNLMKKALK